MHDMRQVDSGLVWKGGQGNDPLHPHQLWLRTPRDDLDGLRRAFARARADLDEGIVEAVLEFCDNAQYHFITRLIFRNGLHQDGSVDYVDTVEAAYKAAVREQKAYLGSK